MSQTALLEAQLAFLEDTVQSLDGALALQQQQLLRLEERSAISFVSRVNDWMLSQARLLNRRLHTTEIAY